MLLVWFYQVENLDTGLVDTYVVSLLSGLIHYKELGDFLLRLSVKALRYTNPSVRVVVLGAESSVANANHLPSWAAARRIGCLPRQHPPAQEA